MKAFITTIFSLLATATFAETQQADSVVSFRDVEVVTIYDNNKSINVELRGKKDDKNFYYNFTQEVKDTANLKIEHSKPLSQLKIMDAGWQNDLCHTVSCAPSLQMGFVCGLGTPSGVKINPAQSVEITLNGLLQYKLESRKSPHALRVEFGLGWRNFRMTDEMRFFKTPEGNIGIGDYAADQELDFSRLKVFSLSVPVLWQYKYTTKKVKKGVNSYKLLLGPIVNFNTYSSMKTRYKQDGKDIADLTKIGHRQPVTIDLYGAIELVDNLGLYVRYSPMNVFSTDHAPKISPLSLGVRLGF